jgi:hypothetical protein
MESGFNPLSFFSELFILVNILAKIIRSIIFEEYGGAGEFVLPANHKAGMKVPKGGSSCKNCKFLSEDQLHCGEKNFIKWNGGDSELPYPADEYCSDWYQPK